MDGISFDSLTYLPDDSFVSECNDDYGGICEDIVRLASATHLVDQLEQQLDNSPPSSSYYASGRCFDKEIPSLFSEMEYLTEVSPETEMALMPCRDVPVAVDPSEFSWKRKDQVQQHQQQQKPDERPGLILGEEALVPNGTEPGACAKEIPAGPESQRRHFGATTHYRLILQNYIQKGKRKLEESSYSKMKATVVSVKTGTNSTSLIETVTCASSFESASSSSSSSSAEDRLPEPAPLPPNFRCHDCNSCFLSVERLKRHTCIIAEQYQCQLCRREFRKRKTLEQHIKSHDKVFSTDDDLRKW
uniref:C2H2-type domain-containing protein n=1 Tax=Culex tarsalis TaxID=7177 RepID=A0A1Q3EW26_CULTA